MRFTMTKSMLVLSFGALAGCGSVAPPEARMASSQAAIRGAREVGAESVPNASLYLKLSEEELGQGKAMMAAGDNAGADLVLRRARADAELALALTRETTAEAEATRLLGLVQQ